MLLVKICLSKFNYNSIIFLLFRCSLLKLEFALLVGIFHCIWTFKDLRRWSFRRSWWWYFLDRWISSPVTVSIDRCFLLFIYLKCLQIWNDLIYSIIASFSCLYSIMASPKWPLTVKKYNWLISCIIFIVIVSNLKNVQFHNSISKLYLFIRFVKRLLLILNFFWF